MPLYEGALVGHPSSDGITIKIPYGVDVLLHRTVSHPSFPIWLVKTKFYSTEQPRIHLFLLGWLKLNRALLLDQLRLA